MVASGLWSVRLRCEVFLSFFELYCRHHVKMVNFKQICVLKLNLVNWEGKKFNQKRDGKVTVHTQILVCLTLHSWFWYGISYNQKKR